MSPTARDSILPALLLVLGVFLLRAAYILWFCPYELAEDEAHYWLWSRFPDWSYYSKGPGVAWAIWTSTRIWGDWEWAVRMPTVILSALGGVAVAALARDAARTQDHTLSGLAPRTVALYAVAAYLLSPITQATGILMTIDGPFLACWALACWAAWRALEMRSRTAWLALGAAFALGFLFKYTMVLLVPGLLLYALLRRTAHASRPAHQRSPWWIIGGLILALAGLLPVVIWNAQHDWVTVKHLLGHLGVRGGDVPIAPNAKDPWTIKWLFEFIGQQLGIVGPLLILALVASARTLSAWRAAAAGPTSRQTRDALAGRMFLFCAGIPVLVFYLGVSFITETEGNWPIAAYVTLLPLAGWWVAGLAAERRERIASGLRPRRGSRFLWHASLVYGLCAAILLHRADLAASTLNAINQTAPFRAAFSKVAGREPRPVAVGRLIGARDMSHHVAGLMTDLREQTGRVPFIVGDHYGRVSQMAYYLMRNGGPEVDVFAAMRQTGGRKSQFDIWPETNLERKDLVGRPAVILSAEWPRQMAFWNHVFTAVEKVPAADGRDAGRLQGEHRPDRFGFLGRDYRGWSEESPTR